MYSSYHDAQGSKASWSLGSSFGNYYSGHPQLSEAAVGQAGFPGDFGKRVASHSQMLQRQQPQQLVRTSSAPMSSSSSSMMHDAPLSPSAARPHHRTKTVHGEDGRRQSLYKTELCRSFEETRHCRYGSKCQFAHGEDEIRQLARHPRYKTEVCKTFHTIGTCPYGKRCRFVHLDGLPRYWSPWSPLNYLLFHNAPSDESTVDEFFALREATEALPPTPSAVYSAFQEARARSQRSMTGYSSSSDDGIDDSGDHQPLIIKPVELHLRRLPIFELLCV